MTDRTRLLARDVAIGTQRPIAGTADDEYSAAGERSNGRPTHCAMPHRGRKTTLGVVSQFGPPAIHRAADAQPARLQRFAAKRHGRPVAERAAMAVAGATRLAEGSVRRRAECVFTLSPPPPRRVAPAPEIPPGRGSSAASRRRRKRSASTRLSERRASPWPRRFADERLWPEATGRPLRPCFTLTPTFRFRTRTTGPSSRSRCIVPGDRTIAMRKLFLLGLALLPAQASSTMAGACPSERDGRADAGDVAPGLLVDFGRARIPRPVGQHPARPPVLLRSPDDRHHLDLEAEVPEPLPEIAVLRAPRADRRRGLVTRLGVDEDGALRQRLYGKPDCRQDVPGTEDNRKLPCPPQGETWVARPVGLGGLGAQVGLAAGRVG